MRSLATIGHSPHLGHANSRSSAFTPASSRNHNGRQLGPFLADTHPLW